MVAINFFFVFAPKRKATYVWNSLPYPIELFLPLPRGLYGWTEYADVITKFSGIHRFEKEINCKNRGRRSCMLSGLLKKAGMASRNIVMKRQYTLLWAALLWFQFSFTYGAPLRALRGRGRSACLSLSLSLSLSLFLFYLWTFDLKGAFAWSYSGKRILKSYLTNLF